MRIERGMKWWLGGMTLGCVSAAIACGSSSHAGAIGEGDAGATLDAAGDILTKNPPEDAGVMEDAASPIDAALGPHATVRVGDFSFPSFNFDFCFSATSIDAGAEWVGPMLRSTETFIQPGTLSRYVYAPVGSQAIRFVLRDSESCTGTVEGVPDFSIPALAQDSRSTIILSGTGFGDNDGGGAPYQVFSFVDEVVPDDAGNRVRLINLAQVGALDVYAYPHLGTEDTSSCKLMFSKVPYGGFGSATTVPGDGGPTDVNGYTPLNGESLTSFTFNTLGFVAQGNDCAMPYRACYGTRDVGHGAWTMFVYADHNVFCEDDGEDATPNCYQD